MKRKVAWALLGAVSLVWVAGLQAQQARPPGEHSESAGASIQAVPQLPGESESGPVAVSPQASVLRLIRFSGVVKQSLGQPRTGAVGLTFALYAEQEGGSPLWLETQNVSLDRQGRYTALLGSTSNEGLPLEIFTSGEARWLSIQVQGQAEQPRVLLVAVPYALKAAEADSLAGHAASDFILTEQLSETVQQEIETQVQKVVEEFPELGAVANAVPWGGSPIKRFPTEYWVDDEKYARTVAGLRAAIEAAEAAGGGRVVVTGLIYLGSATIRVGVGAENVEVEFVRGARVFYSGNDAAFDLCTDSFKREGIALINPSIVMTDAGPSAIGIRGTRCYNLYIERPFIQGAAGTGHAACIKLDGGPGRHFSPNGLILQPRCFGNFARGIQLTGDVVSTQVIGGNMLRKTNTPGTGTIGVDLDVANTSIVLGTSVSGWDLGAHIGAGNGNWNRVCARFEGNAQKVAIDEGAANTDLNCSMTVAPNKVTDNGTKTKWTLTGELTHDFDFSGAGITCETATATIRGAAANPSDTVEIGLPDELGSLSGVNWKYWVSAADTVSLTGCDFDSSNPDPPKATVMIVVSKHSN
jgi:hypothetical protein